MRQVCSMTYRSETQIVGPLGQRSHFRPGRINVHFETPRMQWRTVTEEISQRVESLSSFSKILRRTVRTKTSIGNWSLTTAVRPRSAHNHGICTARSALTVLAPRQSRRTSCRLRTDCSDLKYDFSCSQRTQNFSETNWRFYLFNSYNMLLSWILKICSYSCHYERFAN